MNTTSIIAENISAVKLLLFSFSRINILPFSKDISVQENTAEWVYRVTFDALTDDRAPNSNEK